MKPLSTLTFGSEPRDAYRAIPREEMAIVQAGNHARLITCATASEQDGVVELGTIFQEGDAWVFEDPTGVRTQFMPGENPDEPNATWTLVYPEVATGDPVIDSTYNAPDRRQRDLFYGTPAREGVQYRPKDSAYMGRLETVHPNGLTDSRISAIHFGIGLERDGSVFVRQNATNGTAISVKPQGEPFTDPANRTVEIPNTPGRS